MAHASIFQAQSLSPRLTVTAAAVVCLALLAGCGTAKLQPLEQEAVRKQAALDLAAAQQGVPPIAGELSMEEAMARALKYNLERRTKLMEEALSLNQLDVANTDMLPRWTANAGYTARNKDLITRSEDSVTGLPSLANPYISSERQKATADTGFTWNMLDFGLGYLGARQQADRVLAAGERRRKATHILLQDVRTAFWRTVSAQKLRDDVKSTIAIAEAALVDARKAEEERLRSPLDSLRYQRQLLENLRLLESIEQELATGRIELAALINAPLGAEFRVKEPSRQAGAPLLEVPVARMEEMALVRNADIREHSYNARIAAEETRKTMLRMFPNLSFNYDLRYDNDRFMINNNWNDAGLRLSYNLVNLFTLPTQQRLAEAGVKLAEQRRVAAQMGALTQVHLARLHYQVAYRQFARADAIWQADAKIAEHIKNRGEAEAQSKLEAVANQTTSILSLLRRYQSMSQLQAAASKLQASIGMEPAIGNPQDQSLEALTAQLAVAVAADDAALLGTEAK
jgi:outer membrane protein TolC